MTVVVMKVVSSSFIITSYLIFTTWKHIKYISYTWKNYGGQIKKIQNNVFQLG